eukprot:PhF_6_TR19190/c0_g1_i2/m.28222
MTIMVLAMHHIYSTEKKGYIQSGVQEGNLTGVYLYGRPGRVVVEGCTREVDEYEALIRSLRWSRCCTMGKKVYELIVDEQPQPCSSKTTTTARRTQRYFQ